jgi:prepilin-type N-terminal cleavage/methylation domain-containing protein
MNQSDVHSVGFTLLEVLIALAILTILGGIVFLQFQPIFAQTRLGTATRQVTTDLQYVRAKAISQNRRFRVTFRPASNDYIVEKNENGSWEPHVLHSHTGTATSVAPLDLPQSVRIAALNSDGDIIFLPRGSVDTGMTITLGTIYTEDTRQVVVNLAGRVRIE